MFRIVDFPWTTSKWVDHPKSPELLDSKIGAQIFQPQRHWKLWFFYMGHVGYVALTDWWLSPTPLKNMSSSVGMIIPNNFMEKYNSCSKPPTNSRHPCPSQLISENVWTCQLAPCPPTAQSPAWERLHCGNLKGPQRPSAVASQSPLNAMFFHGKNRRSLGI